MRTAFSRPAALLATATAGGTIAGVRCLASNGIDVGIVSSRPLSAAAWSRHAARRFVASAESDSRFVDQLLDIGKADPGRVLLATSDETAWLFTHNSARLSEHFRVYQPAAATMQRLLDKELLTDAAAKAGLAVLPAWAPRSMRELAALAPTLRYPILIKPRTHVRRLRNDKGRVVHSPTELVAKYRDTLEREGKFLGADDAAEQANLPILQQFVTVGNEGVHSVTGFIDRTGELFVTRRSTKVFLRSWPVGVGICYESLPPLPALSASVRRLCQEVGYFGVFEAEFLWFEGAWAIIDFNPRFFNQMGLDVKRGMPLPLLAWLDASGDEAGLRAAVARAQGLDGAEKSIFYDRFTLAAMLLAQSATSRLSSEERAYWRSWTKDNAANSADVAADRSDPMPGIVHALSEIYLGLKAIPRFVKSSRFAMPAHDDALARVRR
jgi:D-aspartate ligase